MSTDLIVIDVGSTNSSVSMLHSQSLVAHCTRKVGARDSAMAGSNKPLHRALRLMIEEVLETVNAREDEIDTAFAVGMASSSLGLKYVPHCVAPAGLEDIARSTVSVQIPAILRCPIHLVTGVRNTNGTADTESIHSCDLMRAEETQTFGLLGMGFLEAPASIIFLSSHTKIVSLDSHLRIAGSLTTMSGQLLEAVIRETLLAESVRREGWDQMEFNERNLCAGIEDASTWGLTRSLMMPRLMHQFGEQSLEERSSYLEGLLIGSDMMAFRKAAEVGLDIDKPIILVGPKARCNVYVLALARYGLSPASRIKAITQPEAVAQATIAGVLKIASFLGLPTC
jgi:2-dehydro-3-deoxygalactonokinase